MNKKIMMAAGFGEEVKLVEGMKCPFCKEDIVLSSFRDSLSMGEYNISGLCQSCQDDTFGTEEEHQGGRLGGSQ